HSLAGVPIVRSGRVHGGLVVQNRTRRQYDEEEIETLQTIAMVLAEIVAAQQIRFDEALSAVRDDVDRMLEAHDMQSGEQREILETFRMFADDRGWIERVREAIASGLTAEAAVQRAFDDVRARLGQSTDPYIRERLSDLQD